MKLSRKLVIWSLVLGTIAIVPLSCARLGGASATPTPTPTTYTVQQGPLVVTIPATGNLIFSQTADISFDGAGTVDQINVKVGDTVTKNEVLATLDATSWQTTLNNAQQKLTSDQRTLMRDQITLNNDVQKLQQALNSLSSSTSISTAQTNFNTAFNNYQSIKNNYSNQPALVAAAKAQLDLAYSVLSSVTTNADPTTVTLDQLQVNVDQGTLDDANVLVATDQQALNDLNAASPQIIAPFDGVVTAVPIIGGQNIAKGTIGVSIADQTKFEANVLVNETDIYNVKIGDTCSVQPNASSSTTFLGTVTAIAPTATISSGVVNYSVTVTVSNTPLSFVGGAGTGGAGQGGGGSGARPGNGQTPSATPSTGGGPTTSGTPGAGGQGGGRVFIGGGGAGSSQAAASAIQLKSGLTVSITILSQSVPNAIQVPARAITRAAGQATVKLIQANGTIANQVVTLGITNGTNTQILTGLNVGDKIQVPAGTSSNTNRAPGFPGGGGGGGVIFRGG